MFQFHLGDNICIAYDNAVKQCPGNEELLSHLFMAYARVLDFKAQQNTALALYKLKPKNPYYFWAVMSVVLQVKLYLDYFLIYPSELNSCR